MLTFESVICEKTVNCAVAEIKRNYLKSDVCMGEFLKTVEIIGLSVEQVVKVYATLYREFEGDEVCRIDEDGMRYSIGT